MPNCREQLGLTRMIPSKARANEVERTRATNDSLIQVTCNQGCCKKNDPKKPTQFFF